METLKQFLLHLDGNILSDSLTSLAFLTGKGWASQTLLHPGGCRLPLVVSMPFTRHASFGARKSTLDAFFSVLDISLHTAFYHGLWAGRLFMTPGSVLFSSRICGF